MGYGRFNNVNPGPSGGRPNIVGIPWAYNATIGGGREDTAEAGFQFRTETNYIINGTSHTPAHFEFHMPEVLPKNGPARRLWSFYVDKSSGETFAHSGIKSYTFFSKSVPDSAYMSWSDEGFNQFAYDGLQISNNLNTTTAGGVVRGVNILADDGSYAVVAAPNRNILFNASGTSSFESNMTNNNLYNKVGIRDGGLIIGQASAFSNKPLEVWGKGNDNSTIREQQLDLSGHVLSNQYDGGTSMFSMYNGQFSVGVSSFGNLNSSAKFEVYSKTGGVLIPRMNTTERNAISSPSNSLLIFNYSTNQFEWRDSTNSTWAALGAGGGGSMVYPGAGIPLSTGSAWGTSITDNSANWNTAFGWGNHAGLYPTITRFNDSLTAHTTRFNGITTSLSGKLGTGLAFLLSDTAAKTWAWTDITGKPTIVSTETDPVYSATAWASSLSKIVTWDSAYARSTRNSYINNATGSGDTILIPTNDSIMVAKRIKLTAGTNISITPNITGSLNEYTIAATGGGGSYTGSKSVLLTSADFTLVNDSTTLVQDRVYAYSSADATRGWKKTNVTNFTSLANKDLMWYNSSTGQWNNVVYNLQKVTEAGFTTDQPVILEEGATFIIPAGIVLPAANRTKIYTKSIGGKPVTATYNADGNEAIIQPLFGTKNIRKWLPAGNSTTIVADGAAALTATGTATAANVATTNRHTIRPGLEYLVTTAATTAVAGFREAAAQKFMGNSAGNGGFTFICTFGQATGVATTTNRLFVGFSSSTSAPTDVEPSTLTNMFGVGWDAADANIQFMSNDGTGTATKTSLGIAVPTADRTSVYRLEMYCPPNSTTLTYTFRDLAAGGSVVTGTVTTDLPAVNTLLAARGWMSVGGTSSVIGIALKSLYIESDF